MAQQPTILLNDGRSIPQLGLGVWQIPNDVVTGIVGRAVEIGYRAVDTAAIYRNEQGVGEALATLPIPREDLFLTTKLWNDSQGYDATLRAFDASLKLLKQDYVDLYLIHWPVPSRDLYLDTWRAFIRLRAEGRTRSIGVSNFTIPHLERLIGETGVTPAVNQIELHPAFQQKVMRAFHAEHGIRTESWSPLGQGSLLADPVIARIARKHGRTPAQVVIRWHLDNGLIVIPKTRTPARLRENFTVFDFALDAYDLAAVDTLDRADGRIGSNPDSFG